MKWHRRHHRWWNDTLGMYIETNGEEVKEPEGITADKVRALGSKNSTLKKTIAFFMGTFYNELRFRAQIRKIDKEIKASARRGSTTFSYTLEFSQLQKLQAHYNNKGFKASIISTPFVYELVIEW